MATSSATVVQRLSIVLIVFVMLTFVLAVTTYLFVRQKLDADKAALDSKTEMAKAKSDLDKSEEEKRKLKEILGFDADKSVETIESDVQELFAKNHEDFKEDLKSYKTFSAWLLKSNEDKDKANKTLQSQVKQLEDEKKKSEESADKRHRDLEVRVQQAEDKFADDKKKLDEQMRKHDELSQSLTAEKQEALERAESLRLLEEEIDRGRKWLAAQRQSQFETQPAVERVKAICKELEEKEKAIARQNQILADMRVADKKLQDTVLAATPDDDRIDGFDGRIIAVNQIDRTVLIDVGSTRGLRTGLVLRVYDPGDERPQTGDFKAVVEIVAVESGALARARIRSDAVGDPILPGDRVATRLWSPDGTFEAVIVGFVQLDADTKPDNDRLRDLIERIGGRVEERVTTSTTMVIDAGLPKTMAGQQDRMAGWKPSDARNRDKQTDEAKRLGIRVVGIDAFLDMMGLDRDALDSNRLPRPGSAMAPASTGNVAY